MYVNYQNSGMDSLRVGSQLTQLAPGALCGVLMEAKGTELCQVQQPLTVNTGSVGSVQQPLCIQVSGQ